MNVTIITGNLGRDPQEIETRNGSAMCRFSVAVSEKRGENETTTWFSVIAFHCTAEYAMTYLQKGDHVLIQGRMTCKSQNDKTYWDLVADRIEKLTRRNNSGHAEEEYTGPDPFADE